MYITKNTVSAEGQVQKDHYTEVFNNGGKVKILFIGNSITRHEPKPEIGWPYDWGMAASCLKKRLRTRCRAFIGRKVWQSGLLHHELREMGIKL